MTPAARILIDAGHNGTTNWRPSTHLYNLGVSHLEQFIVTNYDEDHASDLPNVLNVRPVGVLVSNPSVSGGDLRKLKHSGGIGNGIAALAALKSLYTGSVSGSDPYFGNPSLRYFWNTYPTDFDDENNLSLVAILKAHGLTICFPGDMEVAGWNPPPPRSSKPSGRSTYSWHRITAERTAAARTLFSRANLKPAIVVISDSGIEHATQETVGWYRNRVTGINLNGERRHVLTTRQTGRF